MNRRQLALLILLSTAIGFMMFSSLTSGLASVRPPVVIIGSGLAGLSAAMEALSAGQRVHMLERATKPGGNSIKASSGINGVPTPYQPPGDSIDLFKSDTIRSAGSRYTASRQALVDTLAEQSASAIEWLSSLGVDLSKVAQLGGHSAARTHRGSSGPPPGFAIVSTLLNKLKASEGFTLSTNADVTALSLSPLSVTYQTPDDGPVSLPAASVVFASGGFAGDGPGLLAHYRPDLAGMPSTNDARRDNAHSLLVGAGAELVDMDSVQVHPTGFVDPKEPTQPIKFLAAEALRGEGGILLHEGRRFVNELETREHVSAAIMRLPTKEGEGRQWDVTLLLDPGACSAAKTHVDFYVFKGLLRRTKVRDLDEKVRAAVDAYAAGVAGDQDAFGRKSFGHWTLQAGDADAEVCIGRVTPVTHFTMGGAVIDADARVLNANGGQIGGVFAAGEVTGGLHGDNRLGGSSLLECVVFGRIAGRNAAKAAGARQE